MRRGTGLAAALLSTALLAGCGSSDDADSGAATGGSKEPLKIVAVTTTGGALEQFGADSLAAIEYAADEANAAGGVDGHKVEVTSAQTTGAPPKTVQAAQK